MAESCWVDDALCSSGGLGCMCVHGREGQVYIWLLNILTSARVLHGWSVPCHSLHAFLLKFLSHFSSLSALDVGENRADLRNSVSARRFRGASACVRFPALELPERGGSNVCSSARVQGILVEHSSIEAPFLERLLVVSELRRG